MSSPNIPTIALFGGTAGCGLSVLNHCLNANPNYQINVLARTPEKLSSFTTGTSTYKYPNLQIVKGDIKCLEDVKRMLVRDGKTVDVVVCAIGMVIRREGWGIGGGDQSRICEEAATSILLALKELEAEGKGNGGKGPKMVFISTTGISEHGRDIPCAMIPMYHWMLSVPHKDKKKMEEVVIASERRWVLVRPSFLMNGAEKGREGLRVGVEVPGVGGEKGMVERKEVGYTISREDVGGWIFEECIVGGMGEWEGKIVSLTH